MEEIMIIVNDSNFKEEVLDAALPVLVDFYADWCGPCKMMSPVVEELAKEYDGRVKIVKINVDNSPETAGKYNVMSIPTFILFRNGAPAQTQVGGVPKSVLTDMISQA